MTLIERLEAAEVGSRELDARVWSALFDLDCDFHELVVTTCYDGVDREVHRSSSGSTWVETFDPPMLGFTTSLDAALALAERVLPGHAMNVCKDQGPPEGPEFRWSSVIARHSLEGPVGRPGWWFGVSDTPALAVCVAILKAKETK